MQEGDVRRPVDRGTELVADNVEQIAATWRELCRWDPLLPPDCTPPIAPAVIAAVAAALGRPQPLGWGPDPEVEKVVEVFATAVGSIDLAIGELVCLREAVGRHIVDAGILPPEETLELMARFHMLVDRAIGVAANRTVERLRDSAVVDPLTGLPNRRALERDIRREMARSERYGHRFALLLVGAVAASHPVSDDELCRLADALTGVRRAEDLAYRLGGDEFVVVLPETSSPAATALVERIAACEPPAFTCGISMFPDDGGTLEQLLGVAGTRRQR